MQEEATITIVIKASVKELPGLLSNWADIRDSITSIASIESATLTSPAMESVELETW